MEGIEGVLEENCPDFNRLVCPACVAHLELFVFGLDKVRFMSDCCATCQISTYGGLRNSEVWTMSSYRNRVDFSDWKLRHQIPEPETNILVTLEHETRSLVSIFENGSWELNLCSTRSQLGNRALDSSGAVIGLGGNIRYCSALKIGYLFIFISRGRSSGVAYDCILT
ncbi:hypothetical protein Hamer_G001903 [Homarus americanus]|uniref:Uncharacterized protein n=1 Tax=Homarus americanus TaxID=6706 RepID=A0A8J5MR77_HOMAM|nr:hypothetical protein Hamer_G001903 [Homarus americanus]